MTVWVVEFSDYEDHSIRGVYASLERAKAAHPDVEWRTGPSGLVATVEHGRSVGNFAYGLLAISEHEVQGMDDAPRVQP